MRYLVLSDIHANIEALEAVLADPPALLCDSLLVLGDLVGYGADPNAVVERIRALAPIAMVRGNHDRVACGLDSADGFNPVARAAAEWTVSALTPDNCDFLRALPPGPLEVDRLVEICHGAPFDEDAYITNERHALGALRAADRPVSLFGHTHLPLAVEWRHEQIRLVGRGPRLAGMLPLVDDARYLVNPGSVGQPRDGDPRAGYLTLDTDARQIHVHRVVYAVEQAQAKILDAGLPELLARRLSIGQ